MRTLIATALLLIAFNLHAQDIVQTKDGYVFYQLLDSASATKGQLYSKARTWLAKAATSAKDIIQMDDANAGTLIGKGFFNIHTTGLGAATWPCYCTITIDCRDQKYRMQLSNYYYMGGDFKHSIDQVYESYSKGKMKASNSNFLKAVDRGSKDLMADFAHAMKDTKDDF